MRPNYIIPMSIRIALLGLVFVPVIKNPQILPAVVLLFMGVDTVSFTQVFPADNIYILLGVSAVYFWGFKRFSKSFMYWMLVYAYYFLCALLSFDVEKNFLWLFIAIMLGDMIREEKDLRLLFYSFLLVSIFLSLLFLINRQEFVVQYGHKEDSLERAGWINANVYGGAIAAGGVLALSYLTGILKICRSKATTIISIITAIISFLVLVLNASRGAFVAFALSAAIMVILNKSKWYVKVVAFIVIGSLMYVFYMYDVFALLTARIEEENSMTAGNRSIIWADKLSLFFSISNLSLLFGIGETNCLNLGPQISTHNDFVTALIAYGCIGFIIFVSFFCIYPVLKVKKQNRWTIIVLLMYFIIECFVLEPVFRGYIIEIMYFFFVLKYVLINNKISIQKDT